MVGLREGRFPMDSRILSPGDSNDGEEDDDGGGGGGGVVLLGWKL